MRARLCLTATAVLLAGCPKKEEPKPAPAAKAATAEVEFFGTFDASAVKVSKSLFVAMAEPCSPVPAEAHVFGQKELSEEKIFAEFFPPQGSHGHACAFGFDAEGKVVAFAAYGKNPLTFQGAGEIVIQGVDLKLESLAAPAARPKGM